ncbi:hypothetical protein EV207_13926 [Scopulibacillus darangshiensis]|uniref:Uncharacterized protein n=1 Tax=Scopulibacillus darangshiensis TaxID=442528 RepID=A0A4R2NL23_9BACL|nr:hypothetical protein [Scopulibacillus darangshiensis]TCP21884.1 hypothetical protein EV207_13926 [Scopulibacillus darangshiensis]
MSVEKEKKEPTHDLTEGIDEMEATIERLREEINRLMEQRDDLLRVKPYLKRN